MDRKAMYKLSYGLFILTAKEAEKDNGCIINTAIQAASEPNQLSICVNKANYTHDMIQRTGKFTVSVLSQKAQFELFKHFGFQSGRDTNKFEAFEQCARGTNGIYYITEGTNAYISVTVTKTEDLGSHTMFIGEITDMEVLSNVPSVTYDYYQNNIKPKPQEVGKTEDSQTIWRCRICGYEYVGEELPDKNIKHEYRVRNGAHTDSYWRESMKEALPFIERSFKGENYPQETLKKFTEELHATNKNIKVGNSNIELWLPDDYNSELTYKVLYYSKGEGNVDLTTKKVAVALDSLMQIKRMIIAGFNVKEMILNETNFSAITDAVEKTVHTESNADFRLGLTYGSEADYLYNQSTGNAPAINFFFAEDADIINLSAENRAKIYYLDITDEGSNYNSIFTLFNGLRGAEAPVQYRVRNGLDSEQSAQTGIYSMSYYIGEQLIKK